MSRWPAGRPDVTLRLAGGVGAPAEARGAVGRWMAGRLAPERQEDVLILISELTTNAVRHGGAGDGREVVLHCALGDGAAFFEVCDDGPGFTPPAEPQPAPAPGGGGFGLVLLARLSRRWHVTVAGGTAVWFELAL